MLIGDNDSIVGGFCQETQRFSALVKFGSDPAPLFLGLQRRDQNSKVFAIRLTQDYLSAITQKEYAGLLAGKAEFLIDRSLKRAAERGMQDGQIASRLPECAFGQDRRKRLAWIQARIGIPSAPVSDGLQ
ncbi:MAG: hypothetical protein A4E69_00071 [Syntrophus sp. PtaB.Bin138]|nr:MAG: hypothetical protein A4E69_00071 [Syntrophus sp. PtaB.Bin138]